MKSSKIKSKSAIAMAILFLVMLAIQSCAVNNLGCPNQITKGDPKKEVRG